jgi:hypothetical protein
MSRVYCVKCRKAGLMTCACVETSRVIVWQDRQREGAREPTRSSREIASAAEQNNGPAGTV